MSKSKGQSTVRMLRLLVLTPGILLARNGAVVAADQNTQVLVLKDALLKDSLSAADAIQTSTPSADVRSQTITISSVKPDVSEPTVRFSNNQIAISATRQSVRVARADPAKGKLSIVTIKPRAQRPLAQSDQVSEQSSEQALKSVTTQTVGEALTPSAIPSDNVQHQIARVDQASEPVSEPGAESGVTQPVDQEFPDWIPSGGVQTRIARVDQASEAVSKPINETGVTQTADAEFPDWIPSNRVQTQIARVDQASKPVPEPNAETGVTQPVDQEFPDWIPSGRVQNRIARVDQASEAVSESTAASGAPQIIDQALTSLGIPPSRHIQSPIPQVNQASESRAEFTHGSGVTQPVDEEFASPEIPLSINVRDLIALLDQLPEAEFDHNVASGVPRTVDQELNSSSIPTSILVQEVIIRLDQASEPGAEPNAASGVSQTVDQELTSSSIPTSILVREIARLDQASEPAPVAAAASGVPQTIDQELRPYTIPTSIPVQDLIALLDQIPEPGAEPTPETGVSQTVDQELNSSSIPTSILVQEVIIRLDQASEPGAEPNAESGVPQTVDQELTSSSIPTSILVQEIARLAQSSEPVSASAAESDVPPTIEEELNPSAIPSSIPVQDLAARLDHASDPISATPTEADVTQTVDEALISSAIPLNSHVQDQIAQVDQSSAPLFVPPAEIDVPQAVDKALTSSAIPESRHNQDLIALLDQSSEQASAQPIDPIVIQAVEEALALSDISFGTHAQGLMVQPDPSSAQAPELEAESSITQADEVDLNAPTDTESLGVEDLIIPARFGANYTTTSAGFDEVVAINAFIPLDQTAGEDVTFFEGEGQLIESDPSFRLSLGHRQYDTVHNVVRGGYIGFDRRATDDSTFYQIAAGYEELGENLDFRINGYAPIGDRTNTIQNIDIDTGFQTSSGFQGNQLVLSSMRERQRIFQQENALGGFDVEVGTQLAEWNGGELMGYLGGYLLTGKESSVGGQLRLAANVASNFNLGVSVQHDGLFDTRVAFTIGASFPNRRFQADDEAEFQDEYEVPIRLRDPIARRSNVAVNVINDSEIIVEEDTEPLRNPEEEEDYRFLHVDLALGAGVGDGAYENPFGTVEDAIALINSDTTTYSDGNTIVYVDGEGAPSTTIDSFTIPEQVRVLSQGPEQIIAGMPFPGFPETATRLPFSADQNFNVDSTDPNANGITVSLPDSNDGVFPVITGGANDDLVTMSDNTVLAGFQVENAVGHGVTASNVSNVELRNNLIQDSGGSGIFLDDVGGNVVLFDNEINDSVDRGVYIQNTQTTSSVDVAIAGFELNNNRVGMEFAAVASAGEFPSQQVSISPSTAANTSIGVPGGGSLDNSILNSANQGIIIQATGASLSTSASQEFSLTGATIDGSGDAGIQLSAQTGAHPQEFNVTESVITNSGDHGIEIINGSPPAGASQTASPQEIVIRNSTISDNAGDGLNISLADESAQELVIRGNQITDNTGDGIRSLAQNVTVQEWRTDAATGDTGISENTISGNGGQAIVLDLNNLATIPIASIINNDLSGNTTPPDTDGPDIEFTSTSTPGLAACLIIDGNVTPLGIQLTGADPSLTSGIPSIQLQDLPTLLGDPNFTFLADLSGVVSVSNAPFADRDSSCP